MARHLRIKRRNSKELDPAQTQFTFIEIELLSIVETLKEFRNILRGQHIVVHIGHVNLTLKGHQNIVEIYLADFSNNTQLLRNLM
jgi:hypothetical protein